MSSLPNYLRACRKRAGLTQDDVAFLLGNRTAARVSRYERFRYVPGFCTALALCIIFHKSQQELFNGEWQKVESTMRRRAKRLAARLADKDADGSARARVAFLEALANGK